jgi:hypothetical protein
MPACGATARAVAARPSPTTTQRRRTRTGADAGRWPAGPVLHRRRRTARLRPRHRCRSGRPVDPHRARRAERPPAHRRRTFDTAAIVAALGLTSHPTDVPRIAVPGAPRMLVPVHDRSALLRVRPHFGRLTAACRRYGLLGCFVDTTGAQAVATGQRARVGPTRADGNHDLGRRVGSRPRRALRRRSSAPRAWVAKQHGVGIRNRFGGRPVRGVTVTLVAGMRGWARIRSQSRPPGSRPLVQLTTPRWLRPSVLRLILTADNVHLSAVRLGPPNWVALRWIT